MNGRQVPAGTLGPSYQLTLGGRALAPARHDYYTAAQDAVHQGYGSWHTSREIVLTDGATIEQVRP